MPLLLAALVGLFAGAGCGHSSGSSAPTTSAGGVVSRAVPSIAADAFCTNLSDLNSTAQQVGLDRQLPAERADLDRSTTKAQQVLYAGVPLGSNMGPVVSYLVQDLQVISTWVNTKATQAELNADRTPSGVRKAVDDMGFEFRRLRQWTLVNCKDQLHSDG